jgi:hypothetical protein
MHYSGSNRSQLGGDLDTQSFVQKRVRSYYWDNDVNCATTNLLILSERFGVKLSEQVIASALGMHGAGEYGAQCGLVEETLIFLGIIGRFKSIPDNDIIHSCKEFAGNFENQFSSLLYSILRPEGFFEKNQSHLCERLTCNAICFNIEFINNFISKHNLSRTVYNKANSAGIYMCNQTRIGFGEMPWEEPAPGVRFKAISRDGRKLRLVEFTTDFLEPDWCTKAHVGYVLEGTLEIAFPNMRLRYSSGDGIFILGGKLEKHKASVIGEKVTLILAETV